jgi:hypothetical protein
MRSARHWWGLVLIGALPIGITWGCDKREHLDPGPPTAEAPVPRAADSKTARAGWEIRERAEVAEAKAEHHALELEQALGRLEAAVAGACGDAAAELAPALADVRGAEAGRSGREDRRPLRPPSPAEADAVAPDPASW